MKKLIVIVLCALLVTSATAVLTACKHEHEFVWEEVASPTCFSQGALKGVCSCGETSYRDIPPLTGHESVWKDVVNKQPTCTEDGVGFHICPLCNESKRYTIEATGHSYGEWKMSKQPTCTAKGEEKRACSVCGHEEKRSVDMVAHTLGELIPAVEAGSEPGMRAHYECEVCGALFDEDMQPVSEQDLVIPAVGGDVNAALSSAIACRTYGGAALRYTAGIALR